MHRSCSSFWSKLDEMWFAKFFVKFSFSEKATKNWKNLPFVLTLLSKNSCFVKTGGIFFQILWPSHNVLTLHTHIPPQRFLHYYCQIFHKNYAGFKNNTSKSQSLKKFLNIFRFYFQFPIDPYFACMK